MAELLIKALDATNRDPVKDARGCYKAGDIVLVKPDHHQWGEAEAEPVFVIVRLPGISVEECEAKYLQPIYSKTQINPATGEFAIEVRRAFSFPIAQKTITAQSTFELVTLDKISGLPIAGKV